MRRNQESFDRSLRHYIDPGDVPEISPADILRRFG